MNCSRSEHRETVDGWMDGWRTDPKEMPMNGAQWLTSTALGWLSELFFYPATIPVDKDLDMIILLLTLLYYLAVCPRRKTQMPSRDTDYNNIYNNNNNIIIMWVIYH